jgi:hypothetical protein
MKLKFFLYKRKHKNISIRKAESYRFDRLASLSFTLIKYYGQARSYKKSQEKKAFQDRENIICNQALIKVEMVGMYWS